ncbi:hypothetical protein, partial [Chryseobacterium sp. CH25]|uniref:hypothetical protein n=1 Tax=Chryseobacterium sp. CH25 TaxID=713559 RepID=UPI001E39DB7C
DSDLTIYNQSSFPYLGVRFSVSPSLDRKRKIMNGAVVMEVLSVRFRSYDLQSKFISVFRSSLLRFTVIG